MSTATLQANLASFSMCLSIPAGRRRLAGGVGQMGSSKALREHSVSIVLPPNPLEVGFVFKEWCARQESNLLPCGPETRSDHLAGLDLNSIQ